MSPEVPSREHFADAYSKRKPPWDIGRPQRSVVEIASHVQGAILDCGCGTGENALFFAERGHAVTGIDFLEAPIEIARAKALQRGLAVDFLVKDALTLGDTPHAFDSVLDCGLFHVFSDPDRSAYVRRLSAVTRPGGSLFLLCFSDQEPGEHGPRRVASAEIRAAFADAWTVNSIQETRFEIRADFEELTFSPGGPHAWLAVIRRKNADPL